ncbi:type IV secretion protein Rhs [Sinomonas atrocyanea]|nr:type IV secretion protein Rhs [Sinomonas atrocyanea]GGG63189.1 type IV secretion protein Rhs [Sinomonas atrocyanea]
MDRPSPVGSGDLGGAAVSLMSTASAGYHNCAVKDGTLYCWGEGWAGGLGNGSENDSPTPTKVDTSGALAGTTVTKVVTNDGSTCAIASGRAFCWGEWWVTGTGQISDVPLEIGGLLTGKTVTDITLLDTGACAIADGAPYCWGGNDSGQIGNGQTARFEQSPVAVDTTGALAGKQLTKISGGWDTACAIADHRAYCWGASYLGDIGNGSNTQSEVPVAVGGDLANMDVTDIVLTWVTCAIADGRPYCWGDGAGGMLGTGTAYTSTDYTQNTEYYPKAVDTSGVLAGKTATRIGTSDNATCVLADGKPYCWGTNWDSSLSTAVPAGETAWSPVAIDLTGTVIEGKSLTDLTVEGGSTIVTYQPPPIGTLHLNMTMSPQFTLTTSGDYNADTTGLSTFIYDTTGPGGPQLLASCPTALSCSWTGAPAEKQAKYVAVAAPPYTGSGIAPGAQATSDPLTAPVWTESLASSGNTLTATANYAVDNTGLAIEIYDLSQDGYPRVASCITGASCTVTTSDTGHQYIAAAGKSTSAYGSGDHLVFTNTVGTAGPTAAHETAAGSNPAEQTCQKCEGDPVNTYNGEFFENETDITVPGRGPGLEVTRSYSSQLAAADGPFGYGWSFNYGMSLTTNSDKSVDVHQENGSIVTFTPDANGAYHAPPRVLAALAHNADGTWTYTRRAKETFSFSADGLLNSLSDLNGNTTTLARNSAGQITTATDASGRWISFIYNTQGKIWGAEDQSMHSVWYNYDTDGRLTARQDRAWAGSSYSYNDLNQLTALTDRRGNTTTNVYDALGRVTSQTDRAGGTTTFSYAADGTTIVSPGGRTTVETYAAGQIVKMVKGAGTPSAATWTYTYDPNTMGRTQTTDPLGHTSTATYDSAGNMLTATDPDGNHLSWTYDALNDRISATNAAGVTTTYAYDRTGNLLSTSTPLDGTSQAATTAYGHADSAHPSDTTSVTDPDGKTTTLTYTAVGDLATSTDALGNKTQYTYDVLGRRLTAVSPRGNTTAYTYDAEGRPLTAVDALGNSIFTYAYDPDGNRTRSTDGLSHTTTTAYDALDRPTTVTRADGTTTSSGYDPDGNATTQTDAAGHTTSYAYDSLNRVITSTDPLNRATTYGYDTAGHRTTLTDPSGRTTTTAYDAAGRKTGTTYSDGTTPPETFTYTPTGLEATTADGTGTTTSTYDSLGRLTGQTNSNGQTAAYTYDLAGHLTAIAYPNGKTITRAYDDAGRLTAITDWNGHTTAFAPDADGNTTSTAYANGVTAAASFDAAGRITGITDTGPGNTALGSFTYTRDTAGNITGETNTGGQTGYTYTSLNQLKGTASGAYTYDPTGNPTTLANGATLTYDTASQPATFTVNGNQTSLTYDAQGNRASGPGPNGTTASYTWDEASRLTDATGSSATYSADGLRSSRTPAGGDTARYAWDMHGIMPLMLTDGTVSYLYDDSGNPLEQIDPEGTALYFQHDRYGSTRLLTDAAGNAAASYTYDPYGNLIKKTGAADTALRWNGQAQDLETGLYYLRARYYDPETAQFLSRDPLESVTAQPYQYGQNDPLNQADRTGLDAYHYSYDLGALGTPDQLASYTRANCAFLFPISGCVDNFQAGESLDLHQLMLPFPVRVTNTSSNSFQFVAREGHPEGAGRAITFTFCTGANEDTMLHVDTSSGGSLLTSAWGVRDINFFIAHETWAKFAGNIQTNFDYMATDGYAPLGSV